MKAGYYSSKQKDFQCHLSDGTRLLSIRRYYISGYNEGNYWMDDVTERLDDIQAQFKGVLEFDETEYAWFPLHSKYVPSEHTLSKFDYSETTPTKYNLNIND